MWLSIDERDSRPIYLQIIQQVKEQVRSGALKPGDELPSVRELADSLNINLHTVRSAYLKLRDQGIINLHLGRRATVAKLPPPLDIAGIDDTRARDLESRLQELVTDALLKGLSRDAIRKMLERQLKNDKEE
jgi:GntR family transcriptional regulator